MSAQCCCGRFPPPRRVQGVMVGGIDEPVGINSILHEPLGPEGNFCGPFDAHTLRDVTASLKRLRDLVRRHLNEQGGPPDATMTPTELDMLRMVQDLERRLGP